MYYFKRSFLFDIWQAEGNVIRGCWGRRIAGLPPCLSYSDGFPPVGDLLNLALIWTRMRISDPLMEKVEKFVCTKFLFCSLKKFLNKVQCNPLSQPLLSLFIWNLKVCFPPPLPCWFLFDWITSVAKGRNVPWSHHETPKRRCCIAHQQCFSSDSSESGCKHPLHPLHHEGFNAVLAYELVRCCIFQAVTRL